MSDRPWATIEQEVIQNLRLLIELLSDPSYNFPIQNLNSLKRHERQLLSCLNTIKDPKNQYIFNEWDAMRTTLVKLDTIIKDGKSLIY